MPDSIITTATAALVTATSALAPSFQDTPSFQSFGYYLASQGQYYRAEPSDLQYDFNPSKLAKLTYAPLGETTDPVQLIVYQEDWSSKDTGFYAINIDLLNHELYNNQITPKISKLDEQHYQLTFDQLTSGQVLFISDATGLYSLALDSPSDKLIEIFSSIKESASFVVGKLNRALKSFPDNAQLKALLSEWEGKVAGEKAAKVWADVLKKWQEYQDQQDEESKEIYAGRVERELSYFLSLTQDPQQQAEAKGLQQQILDHRAQAEAANAQAKIVVPDQAELQGPVKRYQVYGEKITITMVDLGTDGDALIRFSGLPNEHNNQVYRHQKEVQSTSTGSFIYTTAEINGNNWNTIVVENGWGGLSAFVYPPGIEERKGIYASTDDKETPVEDARLIYHDYVSRIEKLNASK